MVVLGWPVLAVRTGAIGRTGLGLRGCVTTGSTTAAGTGLRARCASRRGVNLDSRGTARVRTSSRITGFTTTACRTGMRKRLPRRSWRLARGRRTLWRLLPPSPSQDRAGRGPIQTRTPRTVPRTQTRTPRLSARLRGEPEATEPTSIGTRNLHYHSYGTLSSDPSSSHFGRRNSDSSSATAAASVSCARSEGKHGVSAALSPGT